MNTTSYVEPRAMDVNKPLNLDLLGRLQPLNTLSPMRLNELSGLCFAETFPAGADPFRLRGSAGQTVYLLSGELEICYGQHCETFRASAQAPCVQPVTRSKTLTSARAITEVSLLRLDNDLLDIMLTWDQITTLNSTPRVVASAHEDPPEWMMRSGMFSLNNLKYGALSRLPTSAVQELLIRMQRISVHKDQVIIREGDEGDYYYLIESGRASVQRCVGDSPMELAELQAGDAFGEEALVSDSKRNATVTMLSEGFLLRLAKEDFIELLQEPLLVRVDYATAQLRVQEGAVWLDVRYPSEFHYEKMPGAINIPLGEVRHAIGVLDEGKHYIAYCQSGRRSAVTAFILAQRGYNISVLEGGLWSIPDGWNAV